MSRHTGTDPAPQAVRLLVVHDGTLAAAAHRAIASEIQAGVEFKIETCKLSPEADQQLHAVLAQVLDGVVETEPGICIPARAIRIVQALKAYGDHGAHLDRQSLE